MSKRNSEAVPTEKHMDQIIAMFEEAEIDFFQGSDNGATPFIEFGDVKFQFGDDGSLLEIEND